MSDDDGTTLNTLGLDQLLKALKSKPPRTRVGILGSKTLRHTEDAKSGPTNASIGAAHEFGTATMPRRSFLRVPLMEHLGKKIAESGLLDKEVFTEVMRAGTTVPWMKKVAIIAESIVAEAFATGGFGKWPAWKTPGYESNTGDILVDTTQLRNSITSEVK